jgi:putative membrane protein
MFEAIFASAVNALPVFLLHVGSTLAILVLGVMIYMWFTPHHESRLIREGNVAAATSFGAAVIGLALPLAVCLARSVNVADIVIWGVVALVVQLATFFVMSVVAFKDLSRRIENGDMAAAIALSATKVGVAAINAAAIAG